MRHSRVVVWNDDRGFGFLEIEGGARVFLHISALDSGSPRPVVGDAVAFEPGTGRDGRPAAAWAAVVHGSRSTDSSVTGKRSSPRQLSRTGAAIVLPTLLVLAALTALIFITFGGDTLTWLPLLFVGASLVSFLAYWHDKRRASIGGWRVPEATLHLMDIVGGWPGGLLAQRIFRHKTRKASYQFVFWLTVVVNITLIWWTSHSGG